MQAQELAIDVACERLGLELLDLGLDTATPSGRLAMMRRPVGRLPWEPAVVEEEEPLEDEEEPLEEADLEVDEAETVELVLVEEPAVEEPLVEEPLVEEPLVE